MSSAASELTQNGAPAETLRRRHTQPFGAEYTEGVGTRFRFFGPDVNAVRLAMVGREALTMQSDGHGWHELTVADIGIAACRERV